MRSPLSVKLAPSQKYSGIQSAVNGPPPPFGGPLKAYSYPRPSDVTCSRCDLAIQVVIVALLTLHACFDLSELTFSRQELLSLLIDLTLHLDLNLAQLLFLTTQLLFLEADGLVGKIFWVHR
jgi:hypothetical protein